MRLKFIILILLFIATPAMAANIYVAQSSAGGNTGADCLDARAVSSLTVGEEIGGNTIHLCGFVGPFSILGSGSLGNPLIFKWELASAVSAAFGPLINVNSQGYLLFDGGTPCGPGTTCYTTEAANPTGYPSGITGIVEATANGSGLAHQSVTTQAFEGCSGCHDIEIRNLIIRNLYQHTSMSDSTSSADSGSFIFQCSSAATACTGNILIHDNDIHDTGNAISMEHFNSTTIKIYNNELWHNNWALEYSGNGTRTLFFNNNHCHDGSNWDTTGNVFHHNCVHSYMNTSSDSTGTYIYNNRSDGNWGTCCTTSNFLFIEVAPPASLNVFNNVAIQQCLNSNPPITTRTQNSGSGFSLFADNTFLGCSTTGSNVEAIDYYGTTIISENNATENYGQYVVTGSTATFTTLDYNFYGAIGTSGNSPWVCGATNDATFANWQSSCGGDSHGNKLTSLGVNSSTGVPNAGSGLIGVGVNLTSLCSGNLIPLCSDINGNGRPPSGAWTVGAINAPSGTGGIMPSSIIWP
jgi:hypothetical protein